MKKVILAMFLTLTISCQSSSDEEVIDGKQSDTIQLSIKDTCCDYKEQTISISTQGDRWLFSSIWEEGNLVPIDNQDVLPYSILGTWFTIKRTDRNLFKVDIKENTTGKIRYIEIFLVDRNFYICTKIKQTPL